MVASGVKVSEEAKEIYTIIAKNNNRKKTEYSSALFRISDDKKSIIVDATVKGDSEHPYEELEKLLPEKEARFAAVYVEFKDEEKDQSKIALILWVPEGCPLKQKMMMTSTWDAVKSAFSSGSPCHVQMNGEDEKDINMIIDKLSSKTKVLSFDGYSVTQCSTSKNYSSTKPAK